MLRHYSVVAFRRQLFVHLSLENVRVGRNLALNGQFIIPGSGGIQW